MTLFRSISLVKKINLIGTLVIVIFASVIFFYLLPAMESGILAEKQKKLKDIISTVISITEKLDEQSEKGVITKEEAQERVKFMIRSLRFGEDKLDYVWINDFTPVMIAHPFSPGLEGKNVDDMTDKNQKKPVFLFKEFIKACSTPEHEGLVRYTWQWKNNDKLFVPKESFVKSYEPWKWIFGTGIYIEDLRKEMFNLKIRLIFITVICIVISLLLLNVFARKIANGINILKNYLIKVRNGDLTSTIQNKYKDEVGIMIQTFNDLCSKIHETITEVKNLSVQLATSSVELSAAADTFAKNSQSQAASTEEITATIEELTGGVESISDDVKNQFDNVISIQSRIEHLNSDIQNMNLQVISTKELSTNIST